MNKNIRWTDEVCEQVLARLANKETKKQIAAESGVSAPRIIQALKAYELRKAKVVA